jgi:hypothetical protein
MMFLPRRLLSGGIDTYLMNTLAYIDVKDAQGNPVGWIKYDPTVRKKWIALGAYGRVGEATSKEHAERMLIINEDER